MKSRLTCAILTNQYMTVKLFVWCNFKGHLYKCEFCIHYKCVIKHDTVVDLCVANTFYVGNHRILEGEENRCLTFKKEIND